MGRMTELFYDSHGFTWLNGLHVFGSDFTRQSVALAFLCFFALSLSYLAGECKIGEEKNG